MFPADCWSAAEAVCPELLNLYATYLAARSNFRGTKRRYSNQCKVSESFDPYVHLESYGL